MPARCQTPQPPSSTPTQRNKIYGMRTHATETLS
jgi:hypothetical protein